MSSRLPTSSSRRSVSSSIVARKLARRLRRPVDLVLSRHVTEALIPARGVRRSWETAERIAVRSSFAAASYACLRRLRLELLDVERASRARPRRRRGSAAPRRGSARPASDELCVRRRAASVRRPRAVRRRRWPSSCRPAPAAGSGGAALRRRRARTAPERLQQLGTDAAPASRASASASARAALPSAARRAASATKRAHDPATMRNTTSARRFSLSPIVKVWSGGVKYQLASRKPRRPRQAPARSRRPRRRRRRATGTAAGRSAAEVSSRRLSEHGQQRQPERRRPRSRRHARGGRGDGRRRRGAADVSLSSPSGR